MNTLPRVLAAGFLMSVLPLAAALGAGQSPPQDQPETEQAKDADGSDDIRREVGQTMDAIRAYSAERRAEAVADAKRAADQLDRQMQRLQEQTDQRWNRMSDAAKTRSQASMADLRTRRNALAEWTGGMRHGSAAAWAEVRTGFVNSYQDLADAMRKAREEFDRAGDEAKPTSDEDPAARSDGDDKQ